MTEHETNLDELNAGIAQLRVEISALAAEMKHEVPGNGGKPESGWTAFRHRLGEAGARGEKIADGVALEIERHPLIGGMVAFGIGFLIATLLFKRTRKDDRQ
ncbi:MAG: hypothetical protein PHU25_14500 [Deltaproteobacteria bacterium]|nr:hypothetical protein [Deltaproteobacteria bacterium]